MGIDVSRYHGWQGPLRSPWLSTLAIVRVALLQLFRSKLYWFILGLGLMNFLVCFVVIYLRTQINLPAAEPLIFKIIGFRGAADGVVERGYTLFMQRQSFVVMMLLTFAGSLLVGSDFRNKSLPFYLSRRIDRRHYIVGKLLAVSAIISLLTIVPALVLFIEYGLFTSSFDYWLNHWQTPLAVLVYGGVICAALSIMLVTFAAYVERAAPIAITWVSLFVLLARLSDMLRDTTDEPAWKLIDMWYNIHAVGTYWPIEPGVTDERTLFAYSLVILLSVCGICLVLLTRRVRAVDIVS
jgi:ABC-type transport system involved in multi-copper enzyme maturation permease subunit